ncbi:MAG: OpgC domain-containing protein, partial [Alphaproteobacteria bacterium]|nr:OpgC domain-containing protein [Alphaproteobacteria bacterium]
PSFLVYVFVQVTSISVPAYPEGHIWYFNPLAWQFLFTAGAALGLGRPLLQRPTGALLAVALVIAATSLIVKLCWTIHGVWDSFPGVLLKELWPVNKSNLSPIRLVPFFAVVVVVAAYVGPDARFLRAPAAKPLILCGQQSLEIFCLGILLSALGHFLLSEYDSAIGVQVAVNAGGMLTLYLTARMIGWYKAMGRSPQPPPRAAMSHRQGEIG